MRANYSNLIFNLPVNNCAGDSQTSIFVHKALILLKPQEMPAVLRIVLSVHQNLHRILVTALIYLQSSDRNQNIFFHTLTRRI